MFAVAPESICMPTTLVFPLKKPDNAPLVFKLNMVFSVIVKLVPEIVLVPVKIPLTYPLVPVPFEVRFDIVFEEMVRFVGAEAILIPWTNELPVVVAVPPLILSGVLLPIVLFKIFNELAAADTFIPDIPPATDAVVPEELSAPIILFRIFIVPVDAELIPTIIPPDVVGVATIASTPVTAPMILAPFVPILTFPPAATIPQIIPNVVDAPLEVVKLMAVMVLLSTLLADAVPTFISMA
jgi:hypothetical protein